MKLDPLISLTLFLCSVACLAIDVMTNSIVFWMFGMLFFSAAWFHMFDVNFSKKNKLNNTNLLTK